MQHTNTVGPAHARALRTRLTPGQPGGPLQRRNHGMSPLGLFQPRESQGWTLVPPVMSQHGIAHVPAGSACTQGCLHLEESGDGSRTEFPATHMGDSE